MLNTNLHDQVPGAKSDALPLVRKQRKNLGNSLRTGLLLAFVLGVTEPAQAAELDVFLQGHWAELRITSAVGVVVADNYAYTADKNAGVVILDVSVPAKPQQVGALKTSGEPHGVALAGNYAFVADGGAGLQVIDISNPANPQRVGGNSNFPGYGVFATDHHVIVAGGESGLVILHPYISSPGPLLWFDPLHIEPQGVRLPLRGLPGLQVEIHRSADLRSWQKIINGLLGRTGLEMEIAPAAQRAFYRILGH